MQTEPVVRAAVRTVVPRNVVYPFGKLGVGDSFTVKCLEEEYKILSNRLRAAASMWLKRNGQKMRVARVSVGIKVTRIN
jgi:hypothetical protein